MMLCTLLVKIELIALTTDLWKARNGSHFIAITCHFLDDNFNLHSLLISFRRFYSRHLASNLKSIIIRELNKLEILEKIIAITTDNAKDIKKATQKLNSKCIRFSCSPHNINLVIKHALKLWSKPSSIK